MFTASARAAFHRLAARAHEHSARLPTDGRIRIAEDRTDNAWSATFERRGYGCDERDAAAFTAEEDHASDAARSSRLGYPREAAMAHRLAALAAKRAG